MASAYTHTLHLQYKAGNGVRRGETRPITTAEATDPATRAKLISLWTLILTTRGQTLVNWTIKEGVGAANP